MNERIRQLKESAHPKIDWAARYHVELNNGEKAEQENEWFEKFAELIVKEVFSKLEDERFEVYEPVVKAVKKHFGVE